MVKWIFQVQHSRPTFSILFLNFIDLLQKFRIFAFNSLDLQVPEIVPSIKTLQYANFYKSENAFSSVS